MQGISFGLFAATQLLGSALGAHPHHHVDQQAHLTLAADEARLTLRIVPSVDEGAAMFDAIDLDQDGAISATEAESFAGQLIATAQLRVDRTVIDFGKPTVSVPERGVAATGAGAFEVGANATVSLGTREQRLTFEISYDRFDSNWFVQPFYARNLLQASSEQTVARGDDGSVTVILRP